MDGRQGIRGELGKGRLRRAETYARQALHANPEDVRAHCALGMFHLRVQNLEEAQRCFDTAMRLNPRVTVHKELGWLCLERGDIPRAISLLEDHLRRNGADFEAHNLMVERLYRRGRFAEARAHAEMIHRERPPNGCFLTNALVCLLRENQVPSVWKRPKSVDPFFEYNWTIKDMDRERWPRHVLFEDYRFGLPAKEGNEVAIEIAGRKLFFKHRIITIGRCEKNMACVRDQGTSLRHAVIVNWKGDVWIHDLSSTLGTFVEGTRVERKAYIEGRVRVNLGTVEAQITTDAEMLI